MDDPTRVTLPTSRQVFPFLTTDKDDARLEAIKFNIGHSRYEIYISILEGSYEIHDILPHLLSFKNKVKSAVSTEAHLPVALFRIVTRTMGTVLGSVWDQVVADAANEEETVESFDARMLEFLAIHATAEDRNELVQQLRTAKKPRNIPVQTWFYRLRELNSYVELLPGDEPALTDGQLKEAFYNSMPQTWKDRFEAAGKSKPHMTIAEIVRYFRTQESSAVRRQQENISKQKRENGKRRRDKNGSPKPVGNPKKRARDDDDKSDSNKPKGKRISDDVSCPVHPGAGHTWGECNNNAYNKNRKFKKSKPAPGADGNVVSVEEKQTKIVEAQAQLAEMAINDLPDEGMSHCDCFVSEDNVAHHFDSIAYAIQPSAFHEIIDDPIAESFVAFSDQLFVNGDSNLKICVAEDFTQSLRLRSIGIMTAGSVQGHKCLTPLKVLFDTGSDKTMFNSRALPAGANPKTVDGHRVTGIHGTELLNKEVMLTDVSLPEFSPTQRIPGPIRATIFNNENSKYDAIIGMDFMQAIGLDVLCSTKTITWNGNTIPFRPSDYFDNQTFLASLQHSMLSSDEEREAEELGYKSKTILPSKYDEVNSQDVAYQQEHLSRSQQEDLAKLFSKYEKLFSGKLGAYPHRKVHLELKKDARPSTCRPYPVPQHHRQVFKDELKRLCDEGVLSKTGASAWLSPTFLIPKKDGRVRWISDFRQLNKLIKRKVYNLPKISDILQRRKGYQFFSKIDISMHYYTFELDEESKDLCTICTPFGNYRYNRLPMGVSQSPDVAQEIMEDLFRHLEETDVYIDDVGCFNDDWKSHLSSLDKVLSILQENNFTVNPRKCEWAVKETDWLGYWLTPTGLKPWKKKIDAILKLKPPTTATQLRSFLGAINFYRDMFPQRSHTLAPLTKISGTKNNGPIKWTPECQQAFDTMKALLSKDAFLRYPDHNKPFHIYVDASNLQLGAAIMQDNAPVAYYSKKLNKAQQNYTVGEKEMLSIVETLKEFRTMLYGCPNIHVYTDHKNNTFQKLNTQRVLRWRLYMEDFGVQLHYIKGKTNELADALSRLPFAERQDPIETQTQNKSADKSPSEADLNSYFSMAIDDDDLLDCFVHLPASEGVPFVLDYNTIRDAQAGDARLQHLRQTKPNQFGEMLLAPNTRLWCYAPPNHAEWKIYLPTQLLDNAIRWYHLALGHLGHNRLYDTMAQHLYHPDLRNRSEDLVKRCDACQRYKNNVRGHGLLASREASIHPWREVAVDTIGPWTLDVGGHSIEFRALTIIDPVTNLVELIRLNNMTAQHVGLQFENTWLARYPKPQYCIYDQGTEFTGYGFLNVLARHNIRGRPITTKNPQANAICERMHQTVGNALRAMSTLQPPAGVETANQMVDTALANCMYATRAALHSSLQGTPGSLVFQRDMVLDIPVIADWQTIQQHRQQLIDKRLIAANNKRFKHDYHPGDEVLKLAYKPNKLSPRADGPYPIEAVHTNGTVTVRLNPTTIERINIRRLKPYHR